MSGFDDLIPLAQPALASVNAGGTRGRTWRFTLIEINDGNGDPIDLTAATGVCQLLTNPGGSMVAEFTFVGGLGEFTVSLTDEETADINPSDATAWTCSLELGGASVQVWRSIDSRFPVSEQ